MKRLGAGLVFAGVALAVILGFYQAAGPERAGSDPAPLAQGAVAPPRPAPAAASAPTAPAAPAAPPAAVALPKERILQAIEDAAVSYDARELPNIEPFLRHPDAEVRAAALRGMFTLGDAAAAPLLRAASRQAATPQEAVALIEAADYLELPSGSLIKARRAKSAPTATK